jgi:toxin-antitoxin system PIN domain toxin
VFVVDTNVLVYAANSAVPEHDRCRLLVEEWRASSLPWFLTWPIAYEFLRVVTHPRVLEEPLTVVDAWTFLDALLASPALTVLVPGARHRQVAGATFRVHPDLSGNVLHDSHTAILMREHGIHRIVTRDTDFHRFPFVQVIDPLRDRAGEP